MNKLLKIAIYIVAVIIIGYCLLWQSTAVILKRNINENLNSAEEYIEDLHEVLNGQVDLNYKITGFFGLPKVKISSASIFAEAKDGSGKANLHLEGDIVIKMKNIFNRNTLDLTADNLEITLESCENGIKEDRISFSLGEIKSSFCRGKQGFKFAESVEDIIFSRITETGGVFVSKIDRLILTGQSSTSSKNELVDYIFSYSLENIEDIPAEGAGPVKMKGFKASVGCDNLPVKSLKAFFVELGADFTKGEEVVFSVLDLFVEHESKLKINEISLDFSEEDTEIQLTLSGDLYLNKDYEPVLNIIVKPNNIKEHPLIISSPDAHLNPMLTSIMLDKPMILETKDGMLIWEGNPIAHLPNLKYAYGN